MSKRRGIKATIARRPLFAVIVLAAAVAVVFGLSRSASATTASCANPATLAGSAFEIDTNANLKVDTSGCIDWLAGGSGTGLRSGVLAKPDVASGSGDDAFGQGTAEDNANPTIVDGSIPPNKSDLKNFGVFTETSGSAKFLELFWTRINSPQGTTNMDFELNQKFCDPMATPTNCANNGSGITPETPLRTVGDKLITYDLSKGGTVPTISIRTWGGSAWGAATVISGGANAAALGSVNSSSISAADSDGVGPLDPITFGEAAINFSAIFPPGGGCGSFGSAYLKSRSSDSFTAELKDFIAPERVNITNCTGLVTHATASVTIGNPISDTATLSGATAGAGGSITFKAFSDSGCSTQVFTSTVTVNNGNGDYNSGNFTPGAVGTYYWTASYSGDANNAPSSSACGDANESSVVNKASPGIVTHASGPVTVGSAIHDTATLSGGVNPTGSIVFKAFSDSTCQTQVFTSTVPVNNGNGDYGSGDFTPAAVGSYYWTASYSGDGNNQAASTACGDANETSVVNKAPSNAATVQHLFPQDAATISATAGGTPTGDVTFKLYAPGDTTCSGTAVYTETVTLSGAGQASTSNQTFSVAAGTSGTYRWLVTYPGDAKHDGTTSPCGTEQFTATITNG